jgi:uncharacterized DUF497 family protein
MQGSCPLNCTSLARHEGLSILASLNDPIPIYEQDVEGEPRFVYYGETNNARRLLAVIVTERAGKIRAVTAYDLDAGQKRDYLRRRAEGE